MKKKKYVLLAAAVLLLTGLVSAVYAYRSVSVQVENHLALGDVNIGLEEFTADGNLYESGVHVVQPAETISKIPRITNYAMPCYVRAKITYTGDLAEKAEGISLRGIPNTWVKRGNYYYFTGILKSGESVDFFTEAVIPKSWQEETGMGQFGLLVTAEAIQSVHVSPDFSSEDPWGAVQAEVCVHEENGSVQSVNRAYRNLEIMLDGDAADMVAIPSDFFSNLGTLMPGDRAEDSVEIRNQTAKASEIFFSTGQSGDQEGIQGRLLSEVGLRIRMGDTLLYDGRLYGGNPGEEISLGSFAPGETGTLRFELQIPANLKNEFAKSETFVLWNFRAQTDEAPARARAPKTGDPSWVELWGTAAVLGACVGLAAMFLKKRRKGGNRK